MSLLTCDLTEEDFEKLYLPEGAKGGKPIRDLQVSPASEKFFAAAEDERVITIFNSSNNTCVALLDAHKHAGQTGIISVAWSRCGNFVAGSSENSTVSVWDVSVLYDTKHKHHNSSSSSSLPLSSECKLVSKFKYSTRYTRGIQFGPIIKASSSSSSSSPCHVIGVASDEQRFGLHLFDPSSLSSSSGGIDKTTRLLVEETEGSSVNCIHFSGEQDETPRVMVGTDGSKAIIYMLVQEKGEGNSDEIKMSVIKVHDLQHSSDSQSQTVWSVKFAGSPKQQEVAITCGGDHNCCIFNSITGERLHLLKLFTNTARNLAVYNNVAICASWDSRARVFDVHTGKEYCCIERPASSHDILYGVAFTNRASKVILADIKGVITSCKNPWIENKVNERLKAFQIRLHSKKESKMSQAFEIYNVTVLVGLFVA